ncbi:MAG: hypothetical protein ACQES5_03480 [Thermodesulfobacteriota bacterium]|mgnify:CR=1 FL=1
MQGNKLNFELSELLSVPEKNYCGEIHAALELAELLQERGFKFKLKDMCPKNIEQNKWQAKFVCPDKVVVSEENENAARAVCLSVLRACQIQ